MLIDTLALLVHVGPYCILKVTFAQEWKLYYPGTRFFIVFGDSIPACFDTICKGMDTRFDA